METQTPSYIKALLIRNGKKPAVRRVWSIDLETVWLPFFTATKIAYAQYTYLRQI